MSQERVIPVKRFQAVDEAGRTYHIVGSRRVRVTAAKGEKDEELSITLRTVDGLPVRPLGKGAYEIEAGTQKIRVTAAE